MSESAFASPPISLDRRARLGLVVPPAIFGNRDGAASALDHAPTLQPQNADARRRHKQPQ
ncbi:MAG: hypothetical protein KF715_15910 [Candidatus Didemnitutus sp.]|nr:hypothetical protein [Candidatus Didemnitutus sp.]